MAFIKMLIEGGSTSIGLEAAPSSKLRTSSCSVYSLPLPAQSVVHVTRNID